MIVEFMSKHTFDIIKLLLPLHWYLHCIIKQCKVLPFTKHISILSQSNTDIFNDNCILQLSNMGRKSTILYILEVDC